MRLARDYQTPGTSSPHFGHFPSTTPFLAALKEKRSTSISPP